jgi:hypothetical protein
VPRKVAGAGCNCDTVSMQGAPELGGALASLSLLKGRKPSQGLQLCVWMPCLTSTGSVFVCDNIGRGDGKQIEVHEARLSCPRTEQAAIDGAGSRRSPHRNVPPVALNAPRCISERRLPQLSYMPVKRVSRSGKSDKCSRPSKPNNASHLTYPNLPFSLIATR